MPVSNGFQFVRGNEEVLDGRADINVTRPISVLLGEQFGYNPLPSIHAKPGSLDYVVIDTLIAL